jgi:hypothetical protein
VINFRYHVVSLTAVFLALAIGLVVGTAALNGPAADRLKDTVNGLSNQNKTLRDQVTHLKEDTNQQERYAAEAAPYLLDGTLSGRRVAVLALPSGKEYVDGVVDMLTIADAQVSARVEVLDKFTDPAQSVELLDLAHDRAMPASITDLPRNSDGVETSSALLAAVLLDRTTGVTAEDQLTVLTAYREAGYLAVNGKVSGRAEAVVVVAGAPYVDREAERKNAANLTLVAQFDEAGPIVVASSGTAGDGNVVAEVRGDPALAKTVSTVDNVATTQGRIVTAMALAEQLKLALSATGGPTAPRAGHYGIEAGATSLMPKRPGA